MGSVTAFFVAFASGPVLGIGLARTLAPDSLLADTVGMFAFPLAFAAGLQAWLGLAVVTAVADFFRRLPSRTAPRRPSGGVPGSFVFVPLSLLAGLLSGVIVGLASEDRSVLTSTAIHLAAGGLYGSMVWWLARSGRLPFPDAG